MLLLTFYIPSLTVAGKTIGIKETETSMTEALCDKCCVVRYLILRHRFTFRFLNLLTTTPSNALVLCAMELLYTFWYEKCVLLSTVEVVTDSCFCMTVDNIIICQICFLYCFMFLKLDSRPRSKG